MTPAPKGRRYEIIGLLLLAAGLISIGGLLDWNVGFIGLYFAKFLRYLFGLGAWVASGVILLIGTQYVTKHRGIVYSTHFFGLIGLFVSLLAILHHFLVPVGAEILPEYLPHAGGLLHPQVFRCDGSHHPLMHGYGCRRPALYDMVACPWDAAHETAGESRNRQSEGYALRRPAEGNTG